MRILKIQCTLGKNKYVYYNKRVLLSKQIFIISNDTIKGTIPFELDHLGKI